jgi:mRNA-degrading endonuclease RelE of RelBE toxin-antitoxin system
MNSTPRWQVIAADRAQRSLARIPEPDRARLLRAIDEMAANPFVGDFLKLKGQAHSFRRRVGNRRIFFDTYPERHIVHITDIARRSTTTYRKR